MAAGPCRIPVVDDEPPTAAKRHREATPPPSRAASEDAWRGAARLARPLIIPVLAAPAFTGLLRFHHAKFKDSMVRSFRSGTSVKPTVARASRPCAARASCSCFFRRNELRSAETAEGRKGKPNGPLTGMPSPRSSEVPSSNWTPPGVGPTPWKDWSQASPRSCLPGQPRRGRCGPRHPGAVR